MEGNTPETKNPPKFIQIRILGGFYGAQKRTRTSTTVKSLVPETSASTNSATWAGGVRQPFSDGSGECQ